jgi:hypothetical protein
MPHEAWRGVEAAVPPNAGQISYRNRSRSKSISFPSRPLLYLKSQDSRKKEDFDFNYERSILLLRVL